MRGVVVSKRKGLSKKLRFEIFKRDGFQCQYCGATPPAVVLHVDHIVPVAGGGENDPSNLVTSCEPCNLGKGARSLKAAPQSLASAAADAQEREDQLLGYQAIMRRQLERVESNAWEVAEVFMESFGDDGFRLDWLASVKRFIRELGLLECLDAMDKATSYKNTQHAAFKYFCGICWNKIRERN